jgi:hypothetical protein
VTVDVQTDSNAYLGLVPTDDPNGVFAEQVASGELEVAFDDSLPNDTGSDNNGTGLNQDALTVFDNVFEIQNQGTQPVGITLSDGGGNDEKIIVQDAGSIGDSSPAPDAGKGGNDSDLQKGNDEIAVALAAAIGDKNGGSGGSAVILNAGNFVKVDFAVSTGTDTTFPSLNALTIDAVDADDT